VVLCEFNFLLQSLSRLALPSRSRRVVKLPGQKNLMICAPFEVETGCGTTGSKFLTTCARFEVETGLILSATSKSLTTCAPFEVETGCDIERTQVCISENNSASWLHRQSGANFKFHKPKSKHVTLVQNLHSNLAFKLHIVDSLVPISNFNHGCTDSLV